METDKFYNHFETLKMCQLTTRVNNDTRRKITHISRKLDIPISAIIRNLIVSYLEAEPQKQIISEWKERI